MMLSNIINWCFLVAAVALLAVLVRWDLQILQQNSYFNSRYWRWLTSSEEHLTVKRISALALTMVWHIRFPPSLTSPME